MDEKDLIYDWNLIQHSFTRDEDAHPHPIWFDDETLRDGLQSPSARNPRIEEKIELLDYMETLGIQKVDLGLPGAGPLHIDHIDAMLAHISENNYEIRPGCAVRTVVSVTSNLSSTYRLSMKCRFKQVPSSAQVQSDSIPKIGRWSVSSQQLKKRLDSQ